MYSGWLKEFKVNRPISSNERKAALSRDAREQCNERHCVISLNSTYLDVIDRRFRLRGMLFTTVVLIGSLTILLAGLYVLFDKIIPAFAGKFSDWYLIFIVGFIFLGQFIFFCKIILLKDFFTYKYYPIRFNRKTRMVHANLGGRIVSVPWENGFFHIGKGENADFLCDIRCHVLNGNTVVETFAVGHYFDNEATIKEIWEFIRRYMDEGPEHLVQDSGERHANLSVSGTWKDCYMTVMASLNEKMLPFRFLLMPMLLPMVACRWLVLKTSRKPLWSNEILAKSEVAIDDPYRWREPEYMGQFYESGISKRF